MPLSVDELTLRKLILVKQLYQHAVLQSASSHSSLYRILTAIEFDLATETALKAVVNSLDTSRAADKDFQALVQQADSLLTKGGYNVVPDKANIYHVHSIRNDAQHKAKYPNESDVSDCRTYTRDFLRKIILSVWGLEFDKISLANIVQDSEVRSYLSEAEINLDQKDYQESVKKAAVGFAMALNQVKTAFVGDTSPFSTAFTLMDFSGRPASSHEGERVFRSFERMQNTLLYLALGLDYADYIKYQQIAGNVTFTADGNAHNHGIKDNIDSIDAEFVVAYCTDAIIQIENRVGDLKNPFGKDHWYWH